MKRLEINQDNLGMKFSALNVSFSSPSPDLLGSMRFAQTGVKDSYPPPLKSGYFAAIGSCSVKTVAVLQMGTDLLLIITGNSDKLFSGVNIDDLE